MRGTVIISLLALVVVAGCERRPLECHHKQRVACGHSHGAVYRFGDDLLVTFGDDGSWWSTPRNEVVWTRTAPPSAAQRATMEAREPLNEEEVDDMDEAAEAAEAGDDVPSDLGDADAGDVGGDSGDGGDGGDSGGGDGGGGGGDGGGGGGDGGGD